METKVTRAIKPAELPTKVEGAAAKVAPRFLVPQVTKSHALKFPIEWDGVEYREVALSRLKGADFEKYAALVRMGVDHTTIFTSLVTRLPVEIVQSLDADDFFDLMELVKDFIPARFLETESGPHSETGPATQA